MEPGQEFDVTASCRTGKRLAPMDALRHSTSKASLAITESLLSPSETNGSDL